MRTFKLKFCHFFSFYFAYTSAYLGAGGQAPGGHNVICGLYDALKATSKENELYGFKGGPSGLIDDDYIVFDDEYINAYRNTGGFDIIGSGRTKLETADWTAITRHCP